MTKKEFLSVLKKIGVEHAEFADEIIKLALMAVNWKSNQVDYDIVIPYLEKHPD